MAPIPDIGVRYIYVPPVPDWSIPTPDSIPQASPVTLNLGWPIVELPGCVEARETSGNNQLLEDDPQGNLTLCMDASFPSFQPMDYDPDQLVVLPLKNPVKLPPLGGLDGKKDKGNEDSETDQSETQETQNTDNLSNAIDLNIPDRGDIDLPCPRPGSPPPGAPGKYATKVVLGYRKNGDLCETLYQDRALFDVINSYTPPPAAILNTSAIAVSATLGVALVGQPLSKALQQPLMKIVKPLTKKVTKLVLKKILKKNEKILSRRERIQLQKKSLKK